MKQEERTETTRKSAKGSTPQSREDQLISLAVDRAEEKLMDGTASQQLIIQVLKLGTTKARLEKQKLEEEVKLAAAKTEAIQSSQRIEELYKRALNAMKSYGGSSNDEEIIDQVL